MSNLRQLSEKYADVLNNSDLTAIGSLMADNFTLEDPAGRFEGKQVVLDYMTPIFKGSDKVRFAVRSIVVDESAGMSVIEFNLTIGRKELVGTDVIHWHNGLMQKLRAYLYEAKCAAEPSAAVI